jgi:hypothetical protein
MISLLIFELIFSCSAGKDIKIQETPTFKTIYEASYSVKKSREISRRNALKKKVDRIEMYDDKGNLVEYWNYETNGSIYEKTKLEKDSNGKLLKSETYDNTGRLKRYVQAELDSNENIKIYKTFDEEKELVSVQEYQYDNNGSFILISSTTVKTKTFKSVGKYNAKNQLTEMIAYNPDGTIRETRTFKYDGNGNEIESELTRPNGDYTKFVSTYDDQNNILTNFWYDKDGNEKYRNSWNYIYDKNNNWITKKRYNNGELDYVWERKIEYN